MAEKDFRVKNGLVTGSNTVTIGNALYVTSTGDVGIGISNPLTAGGNKNVVLSTSGSGVCRIVSTSLNSGVAKYELQTQRNNSYVISGLNENNGTPFYQLTSGSGVTGGAYYDMRYHIFRSNIGTEYMRITDSGDVGIGINNPGSALHIYKSSTSAILNLSSGNVSNTTQIVQETDGDAGIINYSSNSTLYLSQSGSNGSISFLINNSEKVKIDSAGNIGIGNTTPAQKLHVQGTGLATSDFRAPIFYNSQDVNCFWSNSHLSLRGNSPTITFRDVDNNSAMIHCNDGVLYFLRGVTDTSTASAINSTWPLTLNLQNNDAVFGNTVTANGGLYTLSGAYAPVFYDYNNPAYYMNLEGNSVVNSVTANTVYLNRLYDTNNNLYPKLLSTITVSDSASISSSDVFSVAGSGYSDFMITFYRLFPSVNGQQIYLRWYGGGAYQSTNYVTYTAAFNAGGSQAYAPTTYFNVTHVGSNTSSRGYTGNIHIYNASATTTYKQWIHDASGYDSAGVITRVLGGGDLNLAAAITGFQLYAASGNISGTVKIYGLS